MKRSFIPSQSHVIQTTFTTEPGFEGPLCIGDLPSESRVILRHRDFNLHEVVAWGIPGQAKVLRGTNAAKAPMIPDLVARGSRTIGIAFIEFTDALGTERYSLTGPLGDTGFISMHRAGEIMRTREHHRAVGRFGWIWYSVTLRADMNQIDFCVDWHNGIPGPDRPFTKVRVGTVTGLRVQTRETWLGSTLDAILPKRFHRAFRFSIVQTNAPAEPEYIYSSLERFLEFKVPDIGPVSYTDRLTQMINMTPKGKCWVAGGLDDPSNSAYGGVTGGQQMTMHYGIEWVASGDHQAHEYFMREQERNVCRDRVDLELDGNPLRPNEHLDAHGMSTWRKFDDWETPMFQWPAPNYRQAQDDPRNFSDYDLQHDIRDSNEDLVLFWMANDWLAKKQILRGRANARTVFYEGPGRANRLFMPAMAQGTGLGRAEAFAFWIGAWAQCIEHRPEYDAWLEMFASILTHAQMPNLLFQVNVGAKEAKYAPFNSNFVLGSSLEECYLLTALFQIGEFSREIQDHAFGMRDMAWALNGHGPSFSGGAWSHLAVGTGSVRYHTRGDWPTEITEAFATGQHFEYVDAFHLPYAVAIYKLVGSSAADELLMRLAGKPTVPEALAEVRRWTTLPNKTSRGGTPIDNYWPILGAWS